MKIINKTMIALSLILSVGIAQAETKDNFVKDDWFLAEVKAPVKTIERVTTMGSMIVTRFMVYNDAGFRTNVKVVIDRDGILPIKMNNVFSPYRGNERSVISTTVLTEGDEVLRTQESTKETKEIWIADLVIESTQGEMVHKMILNDTGEVLSVSVLSAGESEGITSDYYYFESQEDYQSKAAELKGNDVAVITKKYDDKGSWIEREVIRSTGVMDVKRSINYRE